MSGAAAVRSLRPLRAVVVPGWLAEVVRPRRAPVPWPEMARAALAICVPLSASFAAGRGSLGVLPATSGLLGTLADAGGPYLSRVKRVCSAAVFGGAAGLTIGAVTHGHGWLAVVALVAVAGVSELLTVRSTATGLNRRQARLLGALNASHLMAEAAVAVGLAGTRPPGATAPAMLTLRDAMAGVARALSRDWYRAWVPLTVAIVFKPDYGSVFARALQRGIGTVVGAVAGPCCWHWYTGRGC